MNLARLIWSLVTAGFKPSDNFRLGCRARSIESNLESRTIYIVRKIVAVSLFQLQQLLLTRITNVPRSSIVRWRRDDAEVMREKGERGVAGVPHWRAHTEIRRQTSLPFREASAALGPRTGEKALHVYLADAARKGMPIGE